MKIVIPKGQIEKEWIEINRLINKAADFIGTHEDLRVLACIDVALNYAIDLRKELERG